MNEQVLFYLVIVIFSLIFFVITIHYFFLFYSFIFGTDEVIPSSAHCPHYGLTVH